MGWLVSQALRESPSKGDEVIARFKKSAEKTPVVERAQWDWFYLCVLRLDNAGTFAAGRTLSRAASTNPLALWAYLQSLGGRQNPLGQRAYVTVSSGAQQKDNTPPLDKNELDHVLECYRGLKARRPDLAQGQIFQYVDDELKRAKRVDEEEKFYRDSVAGATQLGQIAGAFNLAAVRGDTDALILLADRADRLQSGRTSQTFSSGTFYFYGSARSIGQGMSVIAQRKAYADVLRLLDHELASVRRKLERQSPGASRAARARLAMRSNVSSSVSNLGRQDDPTGVARISEAERIPR